MSSIDTHKPRTLNPPNVAAPPPTYDQVAITPLLPQAKLITLAGQTGIDASTKQWPPDIVSQAHIAYDNVAKCLQAAGATPRDIIHVRHYIVTGAGEGDVVDRGWGDVWISFMDREAAGHRPPDTVLGVASLAKKEILYEVEVWAIVNGS